MASHVPQEFKLDYDETIMTCPHCDVTQVVKIDFRATGENGITDKCVNCNRHLIS